MTNFENIDNQFVSLSENELSDIDGGLAPLVIFGVAVSWKAVAGGTALVGSGLAAGYFLAKYRHFCLGIKKIPMCQLL